jgi:DNA-binding XRE family transcriptional regulator
LGHPKHRRHGIATHPNNLKAAIEQSGRKRKWLAEQLGVTRMTLHRYEHGEYPIPSEKQDDLRRLLPETPLDFDAGEVLDAA